MSAYQNVHLTLKSLARFSKAGCARAHSHVKNENATAKKCLLNSRCTLYTVIEMFIRYASWFKVRTAHMHMYVCMYVNRFCVRN